MTGNVVRRRASKTGVVVSDKADKTVVVRVDRIVRHKLYKRYIRRKTKFMAHDETNDCKVGDTVEIVESRPLSARKRWRVRRVVKRGQGAAPQAE
ncbi:MAG TPA: 30S ribosomal protein S17 [Candidatus Polarisedimenticolaceae bacterium]|nr:30S ribosomal protein S17 [Candidatus Polarisedimenticolaceae bacterium]